MAHRFVSLQEADQLIKDAGGANMINFLDFVDKMKRKT